MAHPQQRKFISETLKMFAEYTEGKTLDIGSLDINGSNRGFFFGEYTGLDLGEGKNVDIVSKGHEYDAPDGTFDCIISTECFEHDMFWDKTILNAIRMLKRGGLFLFTCATTGRAEHGTTRAHGWTSPFTSKIDGWTDYYMNLTEADVRGIEGFNASWLECKFSVNKESCDLYFWGIKK